MNKTKIVLLGVFAVLVIFVLSLGSWLMGSYNTMVDTASQVDTSYAAIQSQYQRRFDLVPNLAEATKGYMKHEQQVFKDIADARTNYANSKGNPNAEVQATNQYEGALSRLLVVMENYPILQANSTVQKLMDELTGTENRINVARDRYNETARVYNVLIKSFPKNLIAGVFGFESRELFAAKAEAQDGVQIKLTD